MQYFSTNQQSTAVGFREALFNGLAPDRGLYIPESIPEFDHAFYQKEMTYCELAAEMIHPFVSENISSLIEESTIRESLHDAHYITSITKNIQRVSRSRITAEARLPAFRRMSRLKSVTSSSAMA